MSRQARRLVILAIGILLIAGLLVAGPAHHGLHKASDGVYCDGCALSVAVPPSVPALLGPMQIARPSVVERHVEVQAAAPLVIHSPRGPPTAA